MLGYTLTLGLNILPSIMTPTTRFTVQGNRGSFPVTKLYPSLDPPVTDRSCDFTPTRVKSCHDRFKTEEGNYLLGKGTAF